MKYGTYILWSETREDKKQFHPGPLLPAPHPQRTEGEMKQQSGGWDNILLSFFTNFCDLLYPKLSRAQVCLSVKICLPERSKSVYKPTEKREQHFFPVTGI